MSDKNETNKPNTAQLAKNWLCGAGIAALALISFLVWADDYLSNSTREADVKKLLNEIRTAQTSISSRVTDNRQTLHESSLPKAEADSNPSGH